MIAVAGLIIVFASVLGGFAMVNGPFAMLLQPAELIIIFGAAMGAFITSGTACSLKLSLKGAGHAYFGKTPSKADYLELLSALYALFAKINREGVISVEKDIEDPASSPLFRGLAKNKSACLFIGDTFRVYLTTGSIGELDHLMSVDMEIMHEEEMVGAHNVAHMADSLPGMGIVACVMGVVVTMGAINEPPEVLGHHIGAALVGTFLGILLCYGVFGPIAAKMENQAREQNFFFQSIREAIGAAMRGSSPIIALEYGRRSIPMSFRPSFLEMEQKVKG
ncbi:flagellar motor stator protein MotA [Desulfovibrio litoralis]|uniref:Chemotaxis protein MotA n=1 Tax=Desulfovibrio litoralis DSM 11393 TaxID=1121455 RepID=A0A1M7RUJ3_9BACT|nr:flagellar motor stator protein MotA [Desulfovibrio litoralis]SHN49945.1 chemotaxis protein MotA [Desulfovibrio litoralis DSM 11393]